MADNTKIEWCDATWNPITGCSVVSPGLTTASKTNPVWTGEVRLNPVWLDQPLRWKRPRRIFVCAHGDLFYEGVPDDWIDQVFAVMAFCPRHNFLVVTKRAARMRAYIIDRSDGCGYWEHWAKKMLRESGGDPGKPVLVGKTLAGTWPWPHCWLGVSVEDQRRADERIPELLATPAAMRWISAEPLLGPIDLTRISLGTSDAEFYDMPHITKAEFTVNALKGAPSINWRALDWIVCGGESGPGARPMLASWARSLRDQRIAAGAPFFFKQWGEWIDADQWLDGLTGQIIVDGKPWQPARPLNYGDAERVAQLSGRKDIKHHSDGTTMIRVGKHAAGRLLDGRAWDEYPAEGGR